MEVELVLPRGLAVQPGLLQPPPPPQAQRPRVHALPSMREQWAAGLELLPLAPSEVEVIFEGLLGLRRYERRVADPPFGDFRPHPDQRYVGECLEVHVADVEPRKGLIPRPGRQREQDEGLVLDIAVVDDAPELFLRRNAIPDHPPQLRPLQPLPVQRDAQVHVEELPHRHSVQPYCRRREAPLIQMEEVPLHRLDGVQLARLRPLNDPVRVVGAHPPEERLEAPAVVRDRFLAPTLHVDPPQDFYDALPRVLLNLHLRLLASLLHNSTRPP